MGLRFKGAARGHWGPANMGGNGNSGASPEGTGGQNQRLLLETLMALQTKHGGQSSGGQASGGVGGGGGMTPPGPGHGPGPMRQGLPMSGGGNWGSLGWSHMGSFPPGAGGPGMGLPGISESLLSMYAPGFPGGGVCGPGMGRPTSAAAALDMPSGILRCAESICTNTHMCARARALSLISMNMERARAPGREKEREFAGYRLYIPLCGCVCIRVCEHTVQ